LPTATKTIPTPARSTRGRICRTAVSAAMAAIYRTLRPSAAPANVASRPTVARLVSKTAMATRPTEGGPAVDLPEAPTQPAPAPQTTPPPGPPCFAHRRRRVDDHAGAPALSGPAAWTSKPSPKPPPRPRTSAKRTEATGERQARTGGPASKRDAGWRLAAQLQWIVSSQNGGWEARSVTASQP